MEAASIFVYHVLENPADDRMETSLVFGRAWESTEFNCYPEDIEFDVIQTLGPFVPVPFINNAVLMTFGTCMGSSALSAPVLINHVFTCLVSG
jgi:hypothetical protein